jgi:hypothetical protein
MPLALSCACGTRFEVDETYAGQAVSCPECQRSVKAPAGARSPLRTSGYALASVVLAWVLMLTFVGPLLAVALGLAALVSIARYPDRVTGRGYAWFGIASGILWSAVSFFALSNAELFDAVRERIHAGDVERGGPREIVREKEGFAVTRPSERWGISHGKMLADMPAGTVTLVDPGKDAWFQAIPEQVGPMGITACRQRELQVWREDPGVAGLGSGPRRHSDFRLRSTRSLPRKDGTSVEEMFFDVRILGQPFTVLDHVVKDERTGWLYTLRGWVNRRHFEEMRSDFEKAMDSFRLLRSGR